MKPDGNRTRSGKESPDLIVLSDVHLHEDTPESTVGALIRLLDHYTGTSSPDGRGRCMVTAGDFFDFSMVTAVPDACEVPFSISRRERRYGLDSCGEKAAWKIEYLAGKYREIFLSMARFVAAGNRMVFLPGNHDEELLFPEVQDRLRSLLGVPRDGPESRPGPGVTGSIDFSPWFYLEPDRVYVEHGHFYDSDGVPLSPVRPCPLPPGSAIEMTLGTMITRYLLTLLRGYDFHGDSDMTPWPLFVKVVRTFGTRAPRTIFRYYAMAARVLMSIRERKRKGSPAPALSREQYAQDLGVSKKQLEGLLSATSAPTTDSLRDTGDRLYLLRSLSFAVFVVTTLFLLPQAFRGFSWSLLLPFVPLAVLLFSMRNGNLFGNQLDPAFRDVSRSIQQTLDVPFVLMGHTHRCEARVMESPNGTPRVYINLGAFNLSWKKEEKGHPFLYLERGEDGTLQPRNGFVRTDGSPRIMPSGWTTARTPEGRPQEIPEGASRDPERYPRRHTAPPLAGDPRVLCVPDFEPGKGQT